MSQVVIYGASDDLVEVEGAITEEFNPEGDEGNYLAFSDGTVLSVIYDDDGFWRITPRVIGKDTQYTNVQATDLDDNYSDRVTLNNLPSREGFKWVVFGTAMAKP